MTHMTLYQKAGALFLTLFLFPALGRAQCPQPDFYFHNDGITTGKNKDLTAWADQLSPNWNEGLTPTHYIALPPPFVKTHAKPLYGSIAYVFYQSQYYFPLKITNLFMRYTQKNGWRLKYDKDDMDFRKSEFDTKAILEGIDVVCGEPIDTTALIGLNFHNDQFINRNTLSRLDKKKLTLSVYRKGFAEPRDETITDDGGADNPAEFWKTAAEGRWMPKACSSTQVNFTQLTFAVNFPEERTQVAILHSTGLHTNPRSFIICQTEKELIFYPFNLTGSEVIGSFDQLINWFGQDYISFTWTHEGTTCGRVVYKVTPDGLTEMARETCSDE